MNLSLGQASLYTWAVMAVVMAAAWAVQIRTKNAGTVDVYWSFGTGGVAAIFAAAAPGDPARRALVAALALAWSLRLGGHLLTRVSAEREDVRYARMRVQLGRRAQPVFFLFFQLQAAWALLFALPMWAAASNASPAFSLGDGIGVFVGVVAVLGEGLADRQLASFRALPENRGRVCRDGLWRFSRHPNYFFEWAHWWAYVAIAWGGDALALALVGPALMYVFLTRITGIPFLEARALESRGDAYRRYQATTNRLFPWPPRQSETSHA